MIDLKALAGGRYKIRLDESATIDRERANRVWYYQIPCKYGHISSHSATMLAAFARGRIMPSKLARLPFVQVHQRGEHEVTVLFTPDRLDEVASLLGARKRRQISESQRQISAERFRLYREQASFPHERASSSA